MIEDSLGARSYLWLVSGAAGFIGSHLLEGLLSRGQRVVAFDNFSTGSASNLEAVKAGVGEDAWGRLRFVEADLLDLSACRELCRGVDFVLHQAAVGSVPRSIDSPLGTHASNLTGFLNMLVAAKEANVRRFVYASSSSVYGDSEEIPKVEDRTGAPLSPYAVSKVAGELYAGVFSRAYAMRLVGLRYFNVFGPRQNPDGPYAAVIPKWISLMLQGKGCVIYGDGYTKRDFCYVDNVVEANFLAALCNMTDTCDLPEISGCGPLCGVCNIAASAEMSLLELHGMICRKLSLVSGRKIDDTVTFEAFRPGDIRRSLADVERARRVLGYVPRFSLEEGLDETISWFCNT